MYTMISDLWRFKEFIRYNHMHCMQLVCNRNASAFIIEHITDYLFDGLGNGVLTYIYCAVNTIWRENKCKSRKKRSMNDKRTKERSRVKSYTIQKWTNSGCVEVPWLKNSGNTKWKQQRSIHGILRKYHFYSPNCVNNLNAKRKLYKNCVI